MTKNWIARIGLAGLLVGGLIALAVPASAHWAAFGPTSALFSTTQTHTWAVNGVSHFGSRAIGNETTSSGQFRAFSGWRDGDATLGRIRSLCRLNGSTTQQCDFTSSTKGGTVLCFCPTGSGRSISSTFSITE